jgi:palmitoyltransferase
VCFIAVVINSAFAVSLAGFLIMHSNMLAANCTTIEMYEKERIHPWPYNKGMRRNFEDVFGRRWVGRLYTFGRCLRAVCCWCTGVTMNG